MLPLGGLLISVFIAYRWGFGNALANLRNGAENLIDNYPVLVTIWKISVKYLSPVLIFLVFLYSIGIFN